MTGIFRTVQETGDWGFGAGKNSYSRQIDAIKQNVKTRVQSWKNDCFFDQEAGVDWVNRLGTLNQQALLEEEVRRVILQTPKVTEIVSFNLTIEGRAISLSYEVNTTLSQSFIDTIERNT